ncbi:DUF3311 domain-containing protein [Streptomyces sp. TRM43335]|uniref:DUF3311 domain-containing protein n=1 Tax=Streptomyces taklimakanensis TaxID=2569853 RepID=A0A6G2BF74_9ACTN|nr:DUF3311 domain-containing protein [Streptomyces taklimakanensis]MTE20937.1 DUF3311 domain-containing protein [Streptomyces taklimakanensis]
MAAPPGSPGSHPVVTPARVVVGLCLSAPFVAMLWVDSYAKSGPTFVGVPFFYWYQMLWVPVSAGLTAVAYVLVRRERRARRAATGPAGAARAKRSGGEP